MLELTAAGSKDSVAMGERKHSAYRADGTRSGFLPLKSYSITQSLPLKSTADKAQLWGFQTDGGLVRLQTRSSTAICQSEEG